ncbi:MAG: DUF5915 domain-containing protein, partial [Chloroflexota bacterium]
WLYCGQNVQSNLNFGFGPAEEVKRRLLVLWNVYSFFVTYASIDQFNPNDGVPPLAERSTLDRWIISRLNNLIGTVRDGLDRIDAAGPTRAVERFIDDLSTWYLRLSRRRFWKAEDDGDKRSAHATLHEVLTTLTQLLAPFLPFVSEALYQNLVRSVDPSAPESVHHTAYPELNSSAIDAELERQVEIARTLVGLGRAARVQAAIKTRQPLALARVGVPADAPALRDELREVIERELNVERLEVGGDVSDAVAHVVQAKPALIGPRLGKKVQDVLKALRGGQQTVLPDGSVEVAGETLTPAEVTISTKAKEGFAAAEADGYTLVLDTQLTPHLLQAGLARELVHRIQTMRKDAGFEVEDRIVTSYDADGELAEVFAQFGEYIKQETLSVALEGGNGDADAHAWSGQIEGVSVALKVARAATASRS